MAVRNAMVFLNVPTMQQPEAYVGGAQDLFDGKGELKLAATQVFLAKFMQAFADWTYLIASKTKAR